MIQALHNTCTIFRLTRALATILVLSSVLSNLGATTYTFTGVGEWTDQGLWDVYPNLDINNDSIIISTGSRCDLTFLASSFDSSVIINNGTLRFLGGTTDIIQYTKFISYDTLWINSNVLIWDTLLLENYGYCTARNVQDQGHFEVHNWDWFYMYPTSSLYTDIFINYDTLYNELGMTCHYDVLINRGYCLIADNVQIKGACFNYNIIKKAFYSSGDLSLADAWIYNYGLIDSISFSGSGGMINEGTLHKTGNVNFSVFEQNPQGILNMKIRGSSGPGSNSSEYEQIHSEYLTHLDGSLHLELEGYIPANGDELKVVDGPLNEDDKFAYLDLPDLTGCMLWDIHYDSTGLTLSVVDSLDSDEDGVADCLDGCPDDPLKSAPGICGCGLSDADSNADGTPDCLESDMQIIRQSVNIGEGVRLSGHIADADTSQTWYLGSRTDADSSVIFMNRKNDAIQFGTSNQLQMTLDSAGRLGIGRIPMTNILEVKGEASKSSPGSWMGNSDVRLKTNIRELDPRTTLDQILQLKGITYEWKTTPGTYGRPAARQYGLSAQNVLMVFPELVQEDNSGMLMTSYGTLDPMIIEAIRALQQKIDDLTLSNKTLLRRLDLLETPSKQNK